MPGPFRFGPVDPAAIPLVIFEVGPLGFGIYVWAHPRAAVPGPIPSPENPALAHLQVTAPTSSGGPPRAPSEMERQKSIERLRENQESALENLRNTASGITQEQINAHFENTEHRLSRYIGLVQRHQLISTLL